MELVDQRKAERVLMLKQLYMLADGHLNVGVEIATAGEAIGLPSEESRNIMQDLLGFGFLKILNRGGNVMLTPEGLGFVEELAEQEKQEFGQTYQIPSACGTVTQEAFGGASKYSICDDYWNMVSRSAAIVTLISTAVGCLGGSI